MNKKYHELLWFGGNLMVKYVLLDNIQKRYIYLRVDLWK